MKSHRGLRCHLTTFIAALYLMKFRTIFLGITGVLLLSVIVISYIEWSFAHLQMDELIQPTEVWGHRGLVNCDTIQENSLTSFSHALDSGAQGIELDIFYDDTLHDFVVSHDIPYLRQEDSSLLRLTQVLDSFSNSTHYWLDLKNINKQNINAINSHLQDIIYSRHLNDNIVIEVGNESLGSRLSLLSDLHYLLWIQYNRDNALKKYLKKIYIKYYLLKGHFSGISIGYIMADSDFVKTFHHLPLFLFHSNDSTAISRLKSDYPMTSVVLVDSAYLYHLFQKK